jgi:hypothetical protein
MFAKFVGIVCALVLASASAFGAEVIVVSGDPPGQGFNDPTPATPVGGNPGATVGAQALNVFQRAANIWGQKLVSKQPILVIAFFTPLPCMATSGVLGAAGAAWYFADIPPVAGGKALRPETWYPAALAEKITRQDIIADPMLPFEVFSFFNSDLGKPGCLTGRGWYYGLDNDEPSNRIDLLAVVLHEFGHGLGFAASPTNTNTGARAQGLSSIWETNMLDLTTGKRWIDMNDAERAASARNDRNLVWAGQKANNGISSTLDFRLLVEAANPAVGSSEGQPADFGGPIRGPRNPAMLVAPADAGGVSPTDGCEPFPPNPSIIGNYVLIDRGTCPFPQKVLNAQNAGAAGAIIANNVAVGLPTMNGADPLIFIPSAGVTQAYGAALRAAAPLQINLERDPGVRIGTTQNYPRLYAPTAYSGGSSVSHWDVTHTPNLLMEPNINLNLGSKVKNPEDLTLNLLVDIGW